jgi:hypothetical protein
VSGPWAQVCDGVTDLDNLPPLESAARYIVYALDGTSGSSKYHEQVVVSAGAYLRAYRRGLPDQGLRAADWEVGSIPDAHLLWAALDAVTAAARGRDDDGRAWSIRWAEALLRVWWKRQQEAQR